MRGCSGPEISAAVAFTHSRSWGRGEIASVGSYIKVAPGSGKILWLYYAFGSVLASTDYTRIRLSGSGFGDLSLTNTNITGGVRLNIVLGNLASENTAALIAAGAYNNLWVGNSAWKTDPPVVVSPLQDYDVVSHDKYYRCLRAFDSMGGNTSRFPVESVQDGDGYWQELVTADAGVKRTDCDAENPIEALICGRCGRPA